MKVRKEIEALAPKMREWQEHLHKHPEVALEEVNSAKYIASELRAMGYEVEEGIGTTGLVATLKVGNGSKNLGIRAEFDALPIEEVNELSYRSVIEGKSHLCGHDGHTAMLLGAAKYLIDTKNFNGTLTLIFQPAEETMQGSPGMIADGLFERYPVDAVYAMHNIPGLEKGKLYFREGATMSAVDNWEIELVGKGSHGSMPELSIDPVVAGASLVMALQTIVSRNLSPWHNAVVTIGAFIAGNAGNVIANSAILRLSIRNMIAEDRELVLRRIREITKAQAECYGCTYEIREGQPGAVLVNTPEETAFATQVAIDTYGAENVVNPAASFMSSEDFAFMLQEKPGSYLMIGNGDTPMVHHPKYILDQEIFPIGANYWVSLAEAYLK